MQFSTEDLRPAISPDSLTPAQAEMLAELLADFPDGTVHSANGCPAVLARESGELWVWIVRPNGDAEQFGPVPRSTF